MLVYCMCVYIRHGESNPFHCTFRQICNFLKQGATQAWDSAQDVPYAYDSKNMWVGYDNVKSFQIKV